MGQEDPEGSRDGMIVDASGTPSRPILHHLLSAPRLALLGTAALCVTHTKPPQPYHISRAFPSFARRTNQTSFGTCGHGDRGGAERT